MDNLSSLSNSFKLLILILRYGYNLNRTINPYNGDQSEAR